MTTLPSLKKADLQGDPLAIITGTIDLYDWMGEGRTRMGGDLARMAEDAVQFGFTATYLPERDARGFRTFLLHGQASKIQEWVRFFDIELDEEFEHVVVDPLIPEGLCSRKGD